MYLLENWSILSPIYYNMAISWNKKTKENKKRIAKQQKEEKKEERKKNAVKGQSLEEMMAYLDEDVIWQLYHRKRERNWKKKKANRNN